MKRAVIIVIEIALLFAVLNTSFAQYFLADVRSSTSEWMAHISNYAENKELENLRSTIVDGLTRLNDGQKDYLQSVTTDRGSIQLFHQLYCVDGDKNPYVYGSTLSFVCTEISRSGVLRRT